MDAKDNNNTASNLIPTVPDVSSKHFGIRGKRHIPRDMGPKKLYCCNGKSTWSPSLLKGAVLAQTYDLLTAPWSDHKSKHRIQPE